MRVRLLATDGKGTFHETEWFKPEITLDEIEVKAVLTGVCRSDIDMMLGKFTLLPQQMMGHEGLGEVTQVGANITDVKVGDYVATRGEPAYADYYNVRKNEYVKVARLEPNYILEPVACGINMIEQNRQLLRAKRGRLAILGTGFLAWVAFQTLAINKYEFDIDVIGKSNANQWGSLLKQELQGKYDVIIDLSTQTDYLNAEHLNNNALIVIGTDKVVNQQLGNLIWSSATISFASPRTDGFIRCMRLAEEWIRLAMLTIDGYWTQGYSRDNWQTAFTDAEVRAEGYNRGYIDWRL
jgi:D-arabinose 1-dehydrogenase-like Zn-dependent alcohol dehydrogenase